MREIGFGIGILGFFRYANVAILGHYKIFCVNGKCGQRKLNCVKLYFGAVLGSSIFQNGSSKLGSVSKSVSGVIVP